jgi:ABC transport system ATP-binding/permease protein
MSEEILKALMKLFAIIAKQDAENSSSKNEYVANFLSSQIKSDKVDEYLALYEQFLHEDDDKSGSNEPEKKKLVSVKDSVRTLGICKKINKTLTQKQKVVVLVRLLELLKKDNLFSTQHMELLATVSNVFNIEKNEYEQIEQFIRNDNPYLIPFENCLIISDKYREFLSEEEQIKRIKSEGLSGEISIIQINSVNLFFLRYNGVSEVLLNGLTLSNKNVYLFAQGSTVRLPRGTIFYSDIVSRFLAASDSETITFNANIKEHKFSNGKVALQNVVISEKTGTLVGLMGASGAGKTTLLNILSGLDKPSNGEIYINKVNLIKDYSKVKGIIGYIPQDDLLIEELTVFQNLFYNAKLCFRGLSEKNLSIKVLKTLVDLGLEAIKDVKVGDVLNKKISGGQRKRLNIALELIREPAILFVDEPTSGLSSRDSENVMDLLKELSLKGRLIFVVIHQPSSDIYKMFDKLLLLDTGGFPIYYGNPIEAVIHFKKESNQINSEVGECFSCGNVNPELVFNIIESKVVDEYGNYLPERKVSPQKWNEIYTKNVKVKRFEENESPITNKLKLPSKVAQFGVFLTRDLRSKLSNKQYLLINLLEAPLLAFILSYIIRYVDKSNADSYQFMLNENIPAFIFLSIIVALFIGLTVSAEEIFKDLKILKRESFLNLSRFSYLFSKIVILFSLSAIQTVLFVLIGNAIVEVKGLTFEYWLLLFSIACFANVLGLNISSSFNSAVTIYILIPLIIIPQMILGGAMFDFDKLNENVGGGNKVPIIADAMVSRWGFEALMVNQFVNNKYQKPLYPFEKNLSIANYKMVYFLPKINELADEMQVAVKKGNSKTALKNFQIIRNELLKEFSYFKMLSEANYLKKMSVFSLNEETLDKFYRVVESLNERYIIQFSNAEIEKEKYLDAFKKNKQIEKKYGKIKKQYYNEDVTDLVTASLKKSKIAIENDQLVQIIDPIYKIPVPNNKFDYRSQFYAPKKHFFNHYFNTFYFNITVIWILSLFLFITLYFNSLKWLLKMFSKLSPRKN